MKCVHGPIVLLLLWSYRLARCVLAGLGLVPWLGVWGAALLTLLLAALALQWPLRLLAALALWREWHWPWWAALLAAAPRLLLVLPGIVTLMLARLRHPRPRWPAPDPTLRLGSPGARRQVLR